MPSDGPRSEADIIAAGFEERIKDLFKIFAEAVYTGEPEEASTARFRRGLISAKRVRDLALGAAKDV